MSNMSYCRFHNTLIDLQDCIDTLDNREVASESEKIKAKAMLELMAEFLIDNDLINNNSVNYEGINELMEECKEEE